jgi:mxaA protein
MRLIAFWLALLACPFVQAVPPVAVEFTPPLPFGYSVGSVIRHQVQIFAPTPWQLDIAQLPAKGPLNEWLEIRDFAYERRREKGGIRYRLQIEYQIFPALQEATILEIPPLPLPFMTSSDRQTVSLPAWSFTVNPLLPPKLSDAQVELRPLWQPQAIDLAPYWQRLAWIGGAWLSLGGLYAWRSYRFRQLPFAKALPKIRRAARVLDLEAAFLAFHQALNETAGQALFAAQLADFLTRRPEFAPLEAELRCFFERSKQLFYRRPTSFETDWLAELEKLCRDCTKAEKPCRK